MHTTMVLLVLVILVSLIFDFTNGFHDCSNAIATVVATRVLSWRTAVIMSAVLNFIGAFFSTRVAGTIEHGLLTEGTPLVVLAAAVGAITWNMITWYYGLPSSSSHALVGGLVGAGMVHGSMHSVIWSGVWWKVVVPMVCSPIAGFAIGYAVMTLIEKTVLRHSSEFKDRMFRKLQVASSALMAFSHGSNDAQKTMGIITLALISAGKIPDSHIPLWVIVVCALAMALGSLSGGRRIATTTGEKITKLQPVNGFAAEATAASVIFASSYVGAPVSTTHVVVGSVTGVGAGKVPARVSWNIIRSLMVAWALTLLAAALVAGSVYWLLRHVLPG